MGKCFLAEGDQNDILILIKVKETNSKHKAHCWPVIKTSIQMGGSALWSQVQGEGQKKQEEAMSRTFVNFSQVETETATTPQLYTFGF